MLQILLIDDDVHMLECLKTMLPWTELGYEIAGAAENGSEALQMIQKHMPDIVITDLKMPVMDGLEFCRNLQSLRDDVPIIFLSAYEDFETARLAMKYNVTEYLLKPINPQKIQLLCSILTELSSSRQQQAFYIEICNSSKRQETIVERLQANDADWFNNFFIQFTDCLSCRFQLIKEACLCMIQLLYRADKGTLKSQKSADLIALSTKMEMVSFVAELYDKAVNGSDAGKTDYYAGIFHQVKAFILENYTSTQFDSSMIVSRFHFSLDYLNRIFSSHAGETFNTYISRLRMEHALELLQNLDVSINSVAELSGYSNQNYFARIFKKQMQMTPTEYRMQLRLKQEGRR